MVDWVFMPLYAMAQNANSARVDPSSTNKGEPWNIRKNLFLRYPQAGGTTSGVSGGGHDVIQDKEQQGPGRISHGPGPVQAWPVYIPETEVELQRKRMEFFRTHPGPICHQGLPPDAPGHDLIPDKEGKSFVDFGTPLRPWSDQPLEVVRVCSSKEKTSGGNIFESFLSISSIGTLGLSAIVLWRKQRTSLCALGVFCVVILTSLGFAWGLICR